MSAQLASARAPWVAHAAWVGAVACLAVACDAVGSEGVGDRDTLGEAGGVSLAPDAGAEAAPADTHRSLGSGDGAADGHRTPRGGQDGGRPDGWQREDGRRTTFDGVSAPDAVLVPPDAVDPDVGPSPVTCWRPTAAVPVAIHGGATLPVSGVPVGELLVGLGGPGDDAPEAWQPADAWDVDPELEGTVVRLFVRSAGEGCESSSDVLVADVAVVADYGEEAVGPGVPMDDPALVGWATGWLEPVAYGDGADETWRTPELAVGPATGLAVDVVSLGEGGHIVLRFDPPIADGPGADFAVFENAFSPTFLEFAHVEVSSDGEAFVRLPSAYLGSEPVPAYGQQDPSLSLGLAGKRPAGVGEPFDLATVAQTAEAQDGLLDVDAVTHVRLVDVVGDGATVDSFGAPIYDPTPTVGSAGFDLEAVGVFHQASTD